MNERPVADRLQGQGLSAGPFRWLDIEDDAEEMGDLEVDNFPTLLVEREGAQLFYGPLPPQHEHLKRLLQALQQRS